MKFLRRLVAIQGLAIPLFAGSISYTFSTPNYPQTQAIPLGYLFNIPRFNLANAQLLSVDQSFTVNSDFQATVLSAVPTTYRYSADAYVGFICSLGYEWTPNTGWFNGTFDPPAGTYTFVAAPQSASGFISCGFDGFCRSSPDFRFLPSKLNFTGNGSFELRVYGQTGPDDGFTPKVTPGHPGFIYDTVPANASAQFTITYNYVDTPEPPALGFVGALLVLNFVRLRGSKRMRSTS